MARLVSGVTVWLVVGATMSVVVAWSLAITARHANLDADRETARTVVTAAEVVYIGRVSKTVGMTWASGSWERKPALVGRYRDLNQDLIPPWSGLAEPTEVFANGLADGSSREVVAYGWPVPALWMQISRIELKESAVVTNEGASGSVALPWFPDKQVGGNNLGPRTLPIRPVWRGLVVDSCLYAIVLSVLAVGAQRAIRRHRVRRGLCPRCRYRLTSNMCTECGYETSCAQRMA